MSTKLPRVPFDGQIFIDYNNSKWRWDASLKLWRMIGTADSGVAANETTAGLLSPHDKAVVDSLSIAGGGFGFIVSPALPVANDLNMDGAITGDIKLCSESIKILPIDQNGKEISAPGNYSSVDFGDSKAGFSMTVNPVFLNNLYIEISGPKGMVGDTGPDGYDGADGVTDGARGLDGMPGIDASGNSILSGIQIIDVDGIYDTAVVNLELNARGGVLVAHKSKMNVPSSSAPAQQFNATPIVRTLSFESGGENCRTTLDDWVLSAPSDDPLAGDADLRLLSVPQTAEIGDNFEVSQVKLSDYITRVTTFYKDKLDEFDQKWLKEAKRHIEDIDSKARESLSNVAQKLADCEFERPLQFAVGIDYPGRLVIGGSVTTGSSPTNNLPPSAQFLASPVVIAIYDESNGIYQTGQGLTYLGDYADWQSFLSATSGYFSLRAGILQPAAIGGAPTQQDIEIEQQRLKCIHSETLCNFPPDHVRQQIIVNTLNNGSDPVPTSLIECRVTSGMIVKTFNDIIDNGNVTPTYLMLVIDDSGSLNIGRDYLAELGSDTDVIDESGNIVGGSLLEAVNRIKAQYPNIVIRPAISNADERWLRDIRVSMEETMCAAGLTVPGIVCSS